MILGIATIQRADGGVRTCIAKVDLRPAEELPSSPDGGYVYEVALVSADPKSPLDLLGPGDRLRINLDSP